MNLEQLVRKILRKIARTVIRFPAKWYFNRQFKQAFTDDYDTFWVVDIDNTIADSWKKMTPQYENAFRSQSDKMMSLAPFEAMRTLFMSIPPRTRIIFLSARQYIRYSVTKKWLKKHGFLKADSVIVLVERMKDKTPLLEAVMKNYFEKKTPPQYIEHIEPHQLRVNNEIINNLVTHNSALNKYPLLYFDDLSYNHENGQVLYYEETIAAVKQIPILYIGYKELLQIQDIQIR